MRFLILLVALALPGALLGTPAAAQSRAIDLHKGLGEQNRTGRLFWRGEVEMRFSNPNFGGISAMHVETGGRTTYMVNDRGELAEVILEYNTADRKILLVAEDMPTTRGFTFA
jgi:hypothetical protein